MKDIPFDVARCAGKNCTARYYCARHTSPGRPIGHQTHIEPVRIGPTGCEMRIDNNRQKVVKKREGQ